MKSGEKNVIKMPDSTDSIKGDSEIPEVSPPEIKVLKFLASLRSGKVKESEVKVQGLNEREVSSAVSWLEKKRLINVTRLELVFYELTQEGKRFLKDGLPEERAFKLAREKGNIPISSLILSLGEKDGRIAVAQLAKLGMKPIKGEISATGKESVEEVFLKRHEFLSSVAGAVPTDKELLEHFRKREDVILEKKRYARLIELTDLGRIVSERTEAGDSISVLTTEILQTAGWKGKPFRRYDLNAPVERAYSASLHPITYLIEKVRRIFLDLGFTEMEGHYIESSGWNMDALFIPQDHPAREMQDTFYLDSENGIPLENPEVLDIFKKTHEKGIPGYTGWGYSWDPKKARELLLRTHTTVSTIRYLYHHKESPQAAFSVEKVFRHESVDWKHLAELHQIEGTYYGKDANLSTLLWLMKEFYSRLGFKDLKFVPSYYPYTEPSLDVIVNINGKEMELGGSGVFRPEVTRPLGLKEPVVAWGLGLERLAMIYYGFEDIRDIYQSDVDWLRTFTLKY